MIEPMDQQFIEDALDELAARDGELAAGLAEVGYPAPRRRPPGFAALLSIITGQQVSAEAARAIRGRLTALAEPMTAPAFLALDDAALRTAGLSRRKVEYARGIAGDIAAGRFSIEALEDMPDADAIEALTSIRGLGQWSADIYLLFSLGRADVFPAGDLAVQGAMQRLKGLDARPDPARATAVAEAWRPYRGIAAIFLWHYYRGAP